MKILRLELQHFRIHNRLVMNEIAPAMLLIGPNGSGKSSVLEALHFVSTGVSDRAEKIEELVSFNQELGRIKLSVGNDSQEEAEIEAVITRGSVGGRKTQHRLWSVNDVRRTHAKVAEMVHTVLFRPEDMRLIEGSPGRRRKYLDAVLAQVNPQYRHSLQAYEQFLLRRNKVLQAIREGEQPKSVLHYWTEGILKHGQFLQSTRREYVGRISTYELPLKFTAVYNPSILSEERLAAYADKEVAAGHTLVGPHKDDIDVDMSSIVGELPNKPSHLSVLTYGSRGQQRLAVLWLKMAELAFIHETSKESPVLLLDDIFSELDERSQQLVLAMVPEQQTIVTTVEENDAQLYGWQVCTLPISRG